MSPSSPNTGLKLTRFSEMLNQSTFGHALWFVTRLTLPKASSRVPDHQGALVALAGQACSNRRCGFYTYRPFHPAVFRRLPSRRETVGPSCTLILSTDRGLGYKQTLGFLRYEHRAYVKSGISSPSPHDPSVCQGRIDSQPRSSGVTLNRDHGSYYPGAQGPQIPCIPALPSTY